MKKLIFGLLALSLSSCVPAYQHAEQLGSAHERAMTVGTVQREIRRGMTPDQVAEALGSPNIVTDGGEGKEVWIYDKIATEASYSTGHDSAVGLGGGGGSSLLLGGLIAHDQSAGASASTQRTLTVVIKFDKSKRVDSFSYHSSKF